VEGDCGCGRKDKKFKLLGRIDNQIQIWSCRLLLTDIEKAIKNLDPGILSFQITLSEIKGEKSVIEMMELVYEKNESVMDVKTLQNEIYQNSRDLKDTLSFEKFAERIQIKDVGHGEIKRNSRTGKISVIRDQRKN
jgi:phenylacetate-coenzyme A ligase PaaK-like adenylate-forming protein